jgi:seryl-tRNA synthetase
MSDETVAVAAEQASAEGAPKTLAEIRAEMMQIDIEGDPESGNITTPEDAESGNVTTKEPEKKPEEPRAAKAIAQAIKREAEAKRRVKEAEEKARQAEGILKSAEKLRAGEIDPDELLAALGVDYKAITEAKFKHAKPEPDKAERALSEVEALKKQLAEREEALQSQQREFQETQARSELVAAAKKMVAESGDKYDAIQAYGYEDKVVELQIRHYQATFDAGEPEVLTFDQAADIIEEQLAASIQKAASTKYLRSAQSQLATQAKVARPSTLSNSLNGTATEPAPNQGLSLEEARKAIMRMLE